MGVFLGVAAAVAAIGVSYAIYDHLVETFDEAIEKAQESAQAYSETQSKINSLNTELSTTQSRIDELQSKGSLTFVEQQELQNLQSQNQLLQDELAIQQKLAEYRGAQAASDAANVLTNKGFEVYSDGSSYKRGFWQDLLHSRDPYGASENVDIIELTSRKQEALNTAQEKYNQLLQDRNDAASQYGVESKQYLEAQGRVDSQLAYLTQLQGEIADNWDIISSYQNDVTDPEIIQRIKELNSLITGIPLDLKDTDYWTKYYGGASAAAEEAGEEAAELFEEGFDNASSKIKDTLKTLFASEDFEKTKESLEKLSEAADGITTDNIRDLASSSEELNEILQMDGMSAEFLANVLQSELTGGPGFDIITEEALQLNDALDLLTGKLNNVSEALQKYNNSIGSEKNDNFESYSEAWTKFFDEVEAGTTNSNQFWASAELLLGAEYLEKIGYNADTAATAMKALGTAFADNESNGTGLLLMMDDIANAEGEIRDASGELLATISRSGDEWDFKIEPEKFKDLATYMGMSEEALTSLLRGIEMYGNIDWSDTTKAIDSLSSLGLAADTANGKIVNWSATQDYLTTVLGKNNKEVWEFQQALLGLDDVTLIDLNGEIANTISQLEELGYASNIDGHVSINVDNLGGLLADLGYTKATADELLSKLSEVDGVTLTNANGQVLTLEEACDRVAAKEFSTPTGSADDLGGAASSAEKAVDDLNSSSTTHLTSQLNTSATQAWNLSSGLSMAKSNAMSLNGTTATVTTIQRTVYTSSGSPSSSSGYKASGQYSQARGTALASGDWGTAKGGKTLVGELGPELLVDLRSGKWQTIGDHGAEFRNIPAGSIVFNHLQTEDLLRHGYISGRGLALASGTAMGIGGKIKIPTANYPNYTTYKGSSSSSNSSKSSSSSSSSKSSSSKSSSSKSSSSSSSKDFSEDLDWIEVLIDRIERKIKSLSRTATSAFKTLTKRTSALAEEVEAVEDEITYQQKAYERYIQAAEEVSLSDEYKALVRDGKIDLETITDEDLNDSIEEFKSLYEKALNARDSVDELHESLAQLFMDDFDNIQDDFNNQLDLLEHLTKTYENGIDQLEAKGYMESAKYYEALSKVEQQNISILNKELADLTDSFSEAMASGEIEAYSSAWYECQAGINEVKEAIDEANTSLLEYAKTMREIEWGYFDYVEDRISQITQEADFLIDLLSSDKLVNDNGKFTNSGMATMGLHAQNYDVYMAQADQYRDEMLKINKDLASDPYNKDLIERREELLKLQQQSILAAEDEKKAIVDLVHDGIDAQLSALKDLISTYTESLDSTKGYKYSPPCHENEWRISLNCWEPLRATWATTYGRNTPKCECLRTMWIGRSAAKPRTGEGSTTIL